MFEWYLVGNVTFLSTTSERECPWTSKQIPRFGLTALAIGKKLEWGLCWGKLPLHQKQIYTQFLLPLQLLISKLLDGFLSFKYYPSSRCLVMISSHATWSPYEEILALITRFALVHSHRCIVNFNTHLSLRYNFKLFLVISFKGT